MNPVARAPLRPAVFLVIETVTRTHVEELGHRFDQRFVLDRNELLTSFPDLEVLRYEEGVTERSGKPRAVASLVAQRRPGTARGRRDARAQDGRARGWHHANADRLWELSERLTHTLGAT